MATVDFDAIYGVFMANIPSLGQISRPAVVALANFISATARINGRLIMQTFSANRKRMADQAALTMALEYVANELGHPFNKRIELMTCMLIDATYDTAAEKRSELDRIRNDYQLGINHENNNVRSSSRAIYRESISEFDATYGLSRGGICIPIFDSPMAQAITYVSLIKRPIMIPDLCNIVKQYLWKLSKPPCIRDQIGHIVAMTPFAQWVIGVNLHNAEDIMARLRDKRPDLLAKHEAEIDAYIMAMGSKPKLYMSKLARVMVANWGLQ